MAGEGEGEGREDKHQHEPDPLPQVPRSHPTPPETLRDINPSHPINSPTPQLDRRTTETHTASPNHPVSQDRNPSSETVVSRSGAAL